MKGIYFIKNSVNEYHSSISGYFETKEDAIKALEHCADWFRPNGTGTIYFQEFGIKGKCEEILRAK